MSEHDGYVVIVPGIDGLAVCDLLQLVEGIAATTFQEAVDDATIDQFDGTPEHTERVRQLNTTGDATAYWGL